MSVFLLHVKVYKLLLFANRKIKKEDFHKNGNPLKSFLDYKMQLSKMNSSKCFLAASYSFTLLIV